MSAFSEIDNARARIDVAVRSHNDAYREYNRAIRATANLHDDEAYEEVATRARQVAEAIRRLRFARNDLARVQRAVIGGR